MLQLVPEWLIYIFVVLAIVGIVYLITSWFDRKRTEALTAASQQIGFLFVGTQWKDVPQPPSVQTSLFTRGRSKQFRNIMSGSVGGFRTFLFDYRYTVGSGRSSHTYNQTVAAYCKNGAQLPDFFLAGQGALHKLWDKVKHKDISFDSNPEFANRFMLQSADADRTRVVFTPSLLSYLETLDGNRKVQLEGMGDTLIIYRGGKKAKPEMVKDFLDETAAIAGQFFSLGNCK